MKLFRVAKLQPGWHGSPHKNRLQDERRLIIKTRIFFPWKLQLSFYHKSDKRDAPSSTYSWQLQTLAGFSDLLSLRTKHKWCVFLENLQFVEIPILFLNLKASPEEAPRVCWGYIYKLQRSWKTVWKWVDLWEILKMRPPAWKCAKMIHSKHEMT